MRVYSFKTALALTASSAMMGGMMAAPAYAQSSGDTNVEEDVIVTIGTRRQSRSAADVIAPVDVIQSDELLKPGSKWYCGRAARFSAII